MDEAVLKTKVVALAGGVGGAKLVDGLAQALPPENLTVIVNTGDDFEHYGLKICPDLDTICYTLAGLANPATGWGRADESWNAMASLEILGGPTWFRLGDRDLGTHLERTRRLREGEPLSKIVNDFCRAWEVGVKVLPMSDDPVPTLVNTEEGPLAFQDYFVRRKCRPEVKGFTIEGAVKAKPAPGVLEAIQEAGLAVICPSNPWVSIDPILAIPDIRSTLANRPVVAVSPIIAGQALKGPAAKMFLELGIRPGAPAVANHYGWQPGGGLLSGFVMDQVDRSLADSLASSGYQVMVTDSIMRTKTDRLRLAQEVLAFGMKTVALKNEPREAGSE